MSSPDGIDSFSGNLRPSAGNDPSEARPDHLDGRFAGSARSNKRNGKLTHPESSLTLNASSSANSSKVRSEQASTTSSRTTTDVSPLEALLDAEHDFTISPDSSPVLRASELPTMGLIEGTQDKEGSFTRSASPVVEFSGPATPIKSPTGKVKPKPPRLNTANLISPSKTSPIKAISPGLKHWQQVRAAVLAPTPLNERPTSTHTFSSIKSGTNQPAKKFGLVSKAAGRFGFRHAAENVMGYEERQTSRPAYSEDLGGMSREEQEDIARERRKFARDLRTCLDACSAEESLRRLWRSSHPESGKSGNHHVSPSNPASINQQFRFDPNFSAFAPLLTELHKNLPASRAKKPWSRTCPHHDAILAELGVSFLSDGISSNGERQQALEVFGVIVKNWAADTADVSYASVS